MGDESVVVIEGVVGVVVEVVVERWSGGWLSSGSGVRSEWVIVKL